MSSVKSQSIRLCFSCWSFILRVFVVPLLYLKIPQKNLYSLYNPLCYLWSYQVIVSGCALFLSTSLQVIYLITVFSYKKRKVCQKKERKKRVKKFRKKVARSGYIKCIISESFCIELNNQFTISVWCNILVVSDCNTCIPIILLVCIKSWIFFACVWLFTSFISCGQH